MRPLSRRRALVSGAVALASPAFVFAQAYPSKPIRIVDPWPPGSGAEPAIRIVAKKLGEILGQAVFI